MKEGMREGFEEMRAVMDATALLYDTRVMFGFCGTAPTVAATSTRKAKHRDVITRSADSEVCVMSRKERERKGGRKKAGREERKAKKTCYMMYDIHAVCL